MDKHVKLGAVDKAVVVPPWAVFGDEQGVEVAEQVLCPIGEGAVDNNGKGVIFRREIT